MAFDIIFQIVTDVLKNAFDAVIHSYVKLLPFFLSLSSFLLLLIYFPQMRALREKFQPRINAALQASSPLLLEKVTFDLQTFKPMWVNGSPTNEIQEAYTEASKDQNGAFHTMLHRYKTKANAIVYHTNQVVRNLLFPLDMTIITEFRRDTVVGHFPHYCSLSFQEPDTFRIVMSENNVRQGFMWIGFGIPQEDLPPSGREAAEIILSVMSTAQIWKEATDSWNRILENGE